MARFGRCGNGCCQMVDAPGTTREGKWTTCGGCKVTTLTEEWCMCPMQKGSRMTTVTGCPIHGMTASDIAR